MHLEEELGRERFCSFACAARVLDPENKFEPRHAQVFAWNESALDACCVTDADSLFFDSEKADICSQGTRLMRAFGPSLLPRV